MQINININKYKFNNNLLCSGGLMDLVSQSSFYFMPFVHVLGECWSLWFVFFKCLCESTVDASGHAIVVEQQFYTVVQGTFNSANLRA